MECPKVLVPPLFFFVSNPISYKNFFSSFFAATFFFLLDAEVNGVPSCVNHDAMTALAREAWGFQGYITSDCGAVQDVYSTHHYYNTTDAVCNGVLSAGMDIDCGGFLNANLLNAINDGAVSNDTVNNALFNLFMVQMRLGLFDPLDQQVDTHPFFFSFFAPPPLFLWPTAPLFFS